MPEKKTALETLRADLDAIPADDVSPPRAPVHAILRHGRAILDFATEPAPAATLADVGVTAGDLARVAASLDALDEAQRAWRTTYNRRAFEGDLRARLEAAYDLRDLALRAAAFNLGEDPQLAAVLSNVREGEGHGDLLEDLGVLSALLADNAAAFDLDKTLDLDATVARLDDDATALSAALADAAGGDSIASDDAIALRDRAATFARLQLDALRRAGRYAFHDDPRARARFNSLRARSAPKTPPPAPDPA